ncbi:hypothetical protein [Roseibacillus persicicus]|uniref:Uncharacterized protein n=1 Tax=Roseibacillus persicicus TaxID=454148 RepID=A0A918TKJ7_9BACT|nr:hypothetical protein [Roseibacillus persicicus]MDQ8189749.1 hypothetical protein [Roseibacillus persicicus]GHC50315.1 hypothetical protein GCM10007100_15510 [Roseibacillus persicicus]
MSNQLNTLANELSDEVGASLETLESRLRKVERELDLECLNLRDLVNSKDPEINRQLDALGTSISDLHESLSEVRGHLRTAAADGRQIAEATTELEESAPANSQKSNGVELSPEEIGRIRHDEEVTLSGIFRALFMADEPAQRANKKS